MTGMICRLYQKVYRYLSAVSDGLHRKTHVAKQHWSTRRFAARMFSYRLSIYQDGRRRGNILAFEVDTLVGRRLTICAEYL